MWMVFVDIHVRALQNSKRGLKVELTQVMGILISDSPMEQVPLSRQRRNVKHRTKLG